MFMKRCHVAFVPEHVPPATLANNASPLVILAVLHEELTKRGDRVYTQVSQLTNGSLVLKPAAPWSAFVNRWRFGFDRARPWNLRAKVYLEVYIS
jgi:hypothetical protein